MTRSRRDFMEAAPTALELLSGQIVAAAWDSPSVLSGWTVGALAAHLARAITTVAGYLEERPGSDIPFDIESASDYYYRLDLDPNPSSGRNRGIGSRAAVAAGRGPVAVRDEATAAWTELQQRLPAEPPARPIRVADGLVMRLDDYLATRVVELVVHTGDLCQSLGIALPEALPLENTIATLVEVARLRHGDLAVLWALTRRERDSVGALRVL